MGKFLVNGFDKIAEVVRILYIYGCFSNDDFNDSEIRKKINHSLINSRDAYRKVNCYLLHILEGAIETRSVKKKQHTYISKDRFDSDSVRMADLYRFCSKKQMKRSVYNYIDYLCNLCDGKSKGHKKGDKEVREYFGKDTRMDSLFFMAAGKCGFEDKELIQLHNALMFYTGKAPYSVPGCFACDRINDYLRLSGKEPVSDEAVPVFEYNSIDRVVNDNSVCTIFDAIKEKKYIKFISRKMETNKINTILKAHKKKEKKPGQNDNSPIKDRFVSEHMEVYPLKIIYEFYSGRGYLVCWQDEDKAIHTYRLDYIYDTKICNETPDNNKLELISSQVGNFLEHLWISDNPQNKKHIVIDFDEHAEDIKMRVPIGTVTKTGQRSCHYEAEFNYKDIVPFIRRCEDKAHVSAEKSRFLYDYLKNDIEEALKKYEDL